MMRFERDGKHMIESRKKHVYALSVFFVSTLQTHTLGILVLDTEKIDIFLN